jgi:hypothetical protein
MGELRRRQGQECFAKNLGPDRVGKGWREESLSGSSSWIVKIIKGEDSEKTF